LNPKKPLREPGLMLSYHFVCRGVARYAPTLSYIILLIGLLSGCAASQDVSPLPTLAVLPTLMPQIQGLNFWETVSGTLAAPEQVDRWQFSGQAGDAISLQTRGVVNLSLQTSDGSILGVGSELNVTLPADGDYVVLVRAIEGEAGVYELGLGYTDRPNPADYTPTPPPQVVGVPTPTPPFADLGTFRAVLENGAVMGEIFAAGSGRNHVFTFEGRAGQFVTLRMERVSGSIDPLLTLYSPVRAALATDDNGGGGSTALLRNILLFDDGLYSVQAAGGGFPGAYEISLESGDRPQPVTPTIIPHLTATPLPEILTPTLAAAISGVRLEAHIPVIGIINRPGDPGRYPLDAVMGDVLTIGVSPLEDEALRPLIEVYGPSGELVASANSRNSNAGGDALISAFTVLETGAYSVLVTAEGNGTGSYVISYGLGSSREDVWRGQTLGDLPYAGEIARRGLRDVWSLALNPGDLISAAVTPLDNVLDPVLEFVAPDGSLIATDDNGGGYPSALIASARAPVSGLYRLRVIGAGAASSGTYRLIWRYIELAPTITPEPPRILLMSMNDDIAQSEYRFYPFQGRAGQNVQVRVIAQPGSGLDPVVALLGRDGRVIAESDDDGNDLNPRFTAQLPEDGTYSVRVNGYLSSGAFELIVEVLF
jgi:hypothetical protein